MVYFDKASIEAYLERHGYGVVAEPWCRIFYRTGRNRPLTQAHQASRETRERPGRTRVSDYAVRGC